MLTHQQQVVSKIAFVLSLIVGVNFPGALAQGNVQVLHKVDTAGVQWGRAQQKTNADYDVTPLREPVQLQDLPTFTGHATFINGHVHESDNGPSWLMTFKVKESPQQILEWYNNVLRMQQWNIKSATNDTICATKKGSSCTISVQTFKAKDYQAHLEIMYFLAKNSR